jgi:hypothetical protein
MMITMSRKKRLEDLAAELGSRLEQCEDGYVIVGPGTQDRLYAPTLREADILDTLKIMEVV